MSVPLIPDGSVLHRAQSAPYANIEDLAPGETLLVVTPHPDDETLGCGQALAAAASSARHIVLVLLTGGEGSHPNSKKYDAKALTALRRCELDSALRILSPDSQPCTILVGLRDGEPVSDREIEEVLKRLQNETKRLRVGAIWTTWGGDPHCDHANAAAVGELLAEALDVPLWSYVVWGRFGERTVPGNLHRFHTYLTWKKKSAAMGAYRSQLTALIDDDPEGFVMPPQLTAHFADHPEVFVRER